MAVIPLKFLEWTPEYAVHVAEIDRQHRVWFDLVNRLHEAMLAGNGREVLGGLLGETTKYTLHHFAAEENLMAAARYPALQTHVKQHDALRERTNVFVGRFERGESTMTIEFTLFLSEWVRQHTTSADRRLGEYLNTRGSASARLSR